MAARAHRTSLSREERIGLGIALAAHLALVGWLALEPLGKTIQPPPERMTVSFADAVAVEDTSPQPMAEAAPDVAPELGEAPPQDAPEPQPLVQPTPEPAPRPAVTPRPRIVPPAAKPSPKPRPTASSKPRPSASAKPARKPAPAQPDTKPRRRPDAPSGGSRVGDDFLKGIGGESRKPATGAPATRAGPQVAASLRQAVARQLKPNWVAPQGAEAELLKTTVTWSLNRDGSLAGSPQVTGQDGETDANRAQTQRHAEQAIRAIRLAAPFDLPEQYYDSWKRLRFTFDRNLSR